MGRQGEAWSLARGKTENIGETKTQCRQSRPGASRENCVVELEGKRNGKGNRSGLLAPARPWSPARGTGAENKTSGRARGGAGSQEGAGEKNRKKRFGGEQTKDMYGGELMKHVWEGTHEKRCGEELLKTRVGEN
jgi:hypothetical protein